MKIITVEEHFMVKEINDIVKSITYITTQRL